MSGNFQKPSWQQDAQLIEWEPWSGQNSSTPAHFYWTGTCYWFLFNNPPNYKIVYIIKWRIKYQDSQFLEHLTTMLQIHVAIFFLSHKTLQRQAPWGSSPVFLSRTSTKGCEALLRIKGLYRGPWSNVGGMGKLEVLPLTHGPKSAGNFWLPQNLSTNSLLLTEALPVSNINSQSTHTLYALCTIYCIPAIKQAEESHKEKTYSTSGKYPHIKWTPAVWTHVKGQL